MLEARIERRFPALYDARHATAGIARALWPLIGPLLMTLILLPIFVLLAALVALLDVHMPAIQLPSVELPDISLPSITLPAWLRAIGDALGAILVVLGPLVKYGLLVGLAVLGVRRTLAVRRLRIEAQQLGRRELLRRLAVALSSIETLAHERHAERLDEVGEQRADTHAPHSGQIASRVST